MSDKENNAAAAVEPEKEKPKAEAEEEPKAEEDPKPKEENNEEEEASAWGWGGASGWMNSALSSVSQAASGAAEAAKSKSTEVYGFVSKDLQEVSSHVGQAASTVKKSLEVRIHRL